jgi:hypothetical protein
MNNTFLKGISLVGEYRPIPHSVEPLAKERFVLWSKKDDKPLPDHLKKLTLKVESSDKTG